MLAFIICNHVVHLHIAASALLPFKIHQRRKEIKAAEGEREGGALVYKSSVEPTQSNHLATRVQFLIRENKLGVKKKSSVGESGRQRILAIVDSGPVSGYKIGIVIISSIKRCKLFHWHGNL